MKTVGFAALWAGLGLIVSPAVPARASTPQPDDMITTLAGCVGRLSAQVEHEWLMMDATSAETEKLHSGLLLVLDLMAPPDAQRDQSVEILNLRINAKYAQKQLLTRATFNTDPTDATRAAQRAKNNVAECAGLLLS